MQLESYAAAVSSLILFPYVVNRGIHASTLIAPCRCAAARASLLLLPP